MGGDLNEDLERENIEIVSGGALHPDDDDAVPIVKGAAADLGDGLSGDDDELDSKEPDIPYKDEEDKL